MLEKVFEKYKRLSGPKKYVVNFHASVPLTTCDALFTIEVVSLFQDLVILIYRYTLCMVMASLLVSIVLFSFILFSSLATVSSIHWRREEKMLLAIFS